MDLEKGCLGLAQAAQAVGESSSLEGFEGHGSAGTWRRWDPLGLGGLKELGDSVLCSIAGLIPTLQP